MWKIVTCLHQNHVSQKSELYKLVKKNKTENTFSGSTSLFLKRLQLQTTVKRHLQLCATSGFLFLIHNNDRVLHGSCVRLLTVPGVFRRVVLVTLQIKAH